MGHLGAAVLKRNGEPEHAWPCWAPEDAEADGGRSGFLFAPETLLKWKKAPSCGTAAEGFFFVCVCAYVYQYRFCIEELGNGFLLFWNFFLPAASCKISQDTKNTGF